MKVLVIGAGMYVTGRRESGVGTILSSLAELSRGDLARSGLVTHVTVAATRPENAVHVREATDRINATIGTKLTTDYHTLARPLADELPDLLARGPYAAAIVSVPDHLHYAITADLLRARLHCLVVKPLTPGLAEARELVRLQEAHQLHAAVEFHKRHDQANLWIKRELGRGRIGKVLYFSVGFSQRARIPLEEFAAWSGRTNVFQYLGVHYVDLIHFLTGFRPVRAMALGTTGKLSAAGIDTYDSVHATIEWQSRTAPDEKFVAQLATNWIDPDGTSAMSDQKFIVVGTEGRIETDQKDRGLSVISQKGIQTVNPYFSDYLPDPDGNLRFDGYGHQSIATFIRDVDDVTHARTTPAKLAGSRPSLSQGLVSTAVLEAVNSSLATKSEWCDVDDPLAE